MRNQTSTLYRLWTAGVDRNERAHEHHLLDLSNPYVAMLNDTIRMFRKLGRSKPYFRQRGIPVYGIFGGFRYYLPECSGPYWEKYAQRWHLRKALENAQRRAQMETA